MDLGNERQRQYPVASEKQYLVRPGYWRWLLFCAFLLAETGFYRSSDAGQEVFSILGEPAIRRQLKILLESFSSALGSGGLAIFSDGFFAEQIDAFLVVSLGLGRIGGDDLVEDGDCLVHLASVGENGPDVEQVRSGMGRIELGSLVVVGDSIVNLVGLGINLRKVVVIRGQGRVVVGLFLLALGISPKVNRLLEVGGRVRVALLLLLRIGL